MNKQKPGRTIAETFIPSLTTLIKIGSLIIHYQEWTSRDGHPQDKNAIDTLESDPEVIEWISKMTKMAFLPIKR